MTLQCNFDELFLVLLFCEGTVNAVKKTTINGEIHYVLDAIIGVANGIGVENLRGSGWL